MSDLKNVSKEELVDLIKIYSYTNISKMLNCSDSAVRKKAKKWNIWEPKITYTGHNDHLKKKRTCLNCGNELLVKSKIKYCSLGCFHEFKLNEKVENNTASSVTMKRYLLKKYGNVCSLCGISEWNNKKIVMELEHIDGNSDNNLLYNVCLLCPNCHSQTDTYKSKNIGNGRHSRRKRYREGKSY